MFNKFTAEVRTTANAQLHSAGKTQQNQSIDILEREHESCKHVLSNHRGIK